MKALVPIANGSEEMEAVTIIDILVRAGIDVTVASVEDLSIVASRGVKITADSLIDDCSHDTYDIIALPGGMPGSDKLSDCSVLETLLKEQNSANRLIGAICAAPAVVLLKHGLLEGRKATCHPSFKEKMPPEIYSADRVVKSGNIVTSQGPGTALEFTLKLVEILQSKNAAESVASAMVCQK